MNKVDTVSIISAICVPWVPEATRLLNPAGQKAGETSVRSEVSEAPNASSLWWRTPMVSLCLIQILYLITDWLFKNVFLPATAVGQKRSREMNWFFQEDRMVFCGEEMCTAKGFY